MAQFILNTRSGRETSQSITLFYSDGEIDTVPDNHANFAALLGFLESNTPTGEENPDLLLARTAAEHDEVVRGLVHFAASIASELTAVSNRFALSGNRITFDGIKIRKGISRHILRMYRAGDDNWKAIVRFLQRLALNPSEMARENAFAYLDRHDITITTDGQLILYKGVKLDGGSISKGAAFVDGVIHHGSIPNPVGAVVTMPRDMVNPDRLIACSHGLHAGTWTYASSFAKGMTLKVLVHPRDIISVPQDEDEQKVRVCRYRVLEAALQEIAETTYDSYLDDDDDDRCENCCKFDCDCDAHLLAAFSTVSS